MIIRLCRTLFVAALPLAAIGANASTLFSEDFSTGNPVPSTSYSLIEAGVHSYPGQYRVVSNPSDSFTNGYLSYYDHTMGTAAGSMMFFDGSPGGGTIWSQSASLVADTTYQFSFYSSAADSLSQPVLGVLIDGVSIGSTIETSLASWTRFNYDYTPTASGTHSFAIVDLNLEQNGNDGALDDISLTGPGVAAVPEPSTYMMMVAGLAAFGVLRRRRPD